MNSIKKIKWIFLLFSISSLLWVGCANANAKTEQDPLVIYYMEDDINANYYIRNFMSLYPQIEVTRRSFKDPALMDELIVSELNVGEGPDVIIFTGQNGLDVVRMAGNGAFASLDDKTMNDNSFNSEDYLANSVAAGKVNGKQYILPLTIKIPFMTYDGERALGFEPAYFLSHQDFMNSLSSHIDRLKGDENSGVIAFSGSVSEQLLLSSQLLSISENNHLENFDEDLLREVVGWANIIITEYIEKSLNLLAARGTDWVEIYKNFIFFLYSTDDIIHHIWSQENYSREAGVSQLGISVLSEIKSNNVTVALNSYGVMTNNAHPLSYDFLRLAMDANPMSESNIVYGLSANKENIKEKIEEYTNMPSRFYQHNTELAFWWEPLSKDTADTLIQIFDNIDNIVITNPVITDIFRYSFLPYFEKEKSYDECANDFIQKLNLYLTE
ncbi:MAG: hypothetical protein FWG91_00710 [Lachnospiraceae bacterium]|nr:hypothetical protein [Lachnospiraceae bacterium]